MQSPQQCHWAIHKNVPYICEILEEEVTKTDEHLHQKCTKAKNDKFSFGKLLGNLGQMFADQQMVVLNAIKAVKENLEKLKVIFSKSSLRAANSNNF